MMNEGAYLVIWLAGMFGLIGIVSYYLTLAVKTDSMSYDEEFIWQRKVK